MKKAYYAIIGLAILIVGQVSAQTVVSETKEPLSIKWYSASLPKEWVSQTQEVSWVEASANWMDIIRTEESNKGLDRSKAEKISYCDYPGIITSTGFNSWRGVADPSSLEFGNRQHFGFKVYAQQGDFIPSNITYRIISEIWNGSEWVADGTVNGSATMLTTGNTFRRRLDAGPDTKYGTGDDTLSTSQVTSIATNCFIYGGFGVGLGGNSQDKLNSALQYMKANKFRISVTVSVPHSDGNTYIFSTCYMPALQDTTGLNPVYTSPLPEETHAHARWNDTAGLVYELEKSTDMIVWTHHTYTESSSCDLYEENEGLLRQCFYRIKAY